MRLGKDLVGKQVISLTDGRLLGHVKDIYLNDILNWITGVHLGTEGLLRRQSKDIQRENIVVFGLDAILVKNSEVVIDGDDIADHENWVKLGHLRKREIDTPNGTRLATIEDIVIGEDANVTHFTLGRIYVDGPIKEHGRIPHHSIIDTGNEDKVMTVDLIKAEDVDPKNQ